MLQIINQNILDITKGIICHQVNAVGVMGAGLAKAIKEKWPVVFYAYRNRQYSVGSAQIVNVDPKSKLYVANIFGQSKYGNGLQTNYYYVATSFSHLKELIRHYNLLDLPVYVPYKMGCGLGGGDWEIYSSIINKIFPNAIVCKMN